MKFSALNTDFNSVRFKEFSCINYDDKYQSKCKLKTIKLRQKIKRA